MSDSNWGWIGALVLLFVISVAGMCTGVGLRLAYNAYTLPTPPAPLSACTKTSLVLDMPGGPAAIYDCSQPVEEVRGEG